jgi:hypothetical protein
MRSGSQVTGLLVGQREAWQLLYRGTVEWGLFRQVVTEQWRAWKGRCVLHHRSLT